MARSRRQERMLFLSFCVTGVTAGGRLMSHVDFWSDPGQPSLNSQGLATCEECFWRAVRDRCIYPQLCSQPSLWVQAAALWDFKTLWRSTALCQPPFWYSFLGIHRHKLWLCCKPHSELCSVVTHSRAQTGLQSWACQWSLLLKQASEAVWGNGRDEQTGGHRRTRWHELEPGHVGRWQGNVMDPSMVWFLNPQNTNRQRSFKNSAPSLVIYSLGFIQVGHSPKKEQAQGTRYVPCKLWNEESWKLATSNNTCVKHHHIYYDWRAGLKQSTSNSHRRFFKTKKRN